MSDSSLSFLNSFAFPRRPYLSYSPHLRIFRIFSFYRHSYRSLVC